LVTAEISTSKPGIGQCKGYMWRWMTF
jgi:hypothetical protein